MFSRFEIRVINPELATVAHSYAGRIAFHFAPEFVGRLEPNFPRAEDRLLHQPDHSFFLKVSLRATVLANSGEKILEISLGKRRRFSSGCQRCKGQRRKYRYAHATILCAQIQFSKPW